MDNNTVYEKFENDDYIRNVVSSAIFYGKQVYDSEFVLYFDNYDQPTYGTREDIQQSIMENEDRHGINADELHQYLREKRFSSEEFDKYLEIKCMQEEYIFNDKLYYAVLDILPKYLIKEFQQDIKNLYENNYQAYSTVVWGIVEMKYFDRSIDEIIQGCVNLGLNKFETLHVMTYISKYTSGRQRK